MALTQKKSVTCAVLTNICCSHIHHLDYSKLEVKLTLMIWTWVCEHKNCLAEVPAWTSCALEKISLTCLSNTSWAFSLHHADREEEGKKKTSRQIEVLSALGEPAPREDPASARSCLSEFIYNSQNTGVALKQCSGFSHQCRQTTSSSAALSIAVFGFPILKFEEHSYNPFKYSLPIHVFPSHTYSVSEFKIIQVFFATFPVRILCAFNKNLIFHSAILIKLVSYLYYST